MADLLFVAGKPCAAMRVRHTLDRHGRPLAVCENLPGEGAEFSPEQLRALAQALIAVAVDCEDMHAAGRTARPVTFEYPL